MGCAGVAAFVIRLALCLLLLGDAEGWRAGNPSIPFFGVVPWRRTSFLPVPIDVLEKRRTSIQSVQSQKICCCRFGSVGCSWFELAVAACQFLFVAVVEWSVFRIGEVASVACATACLVQVVVVSVAGVGFVVVGN